MLASSLPLGFGKPVIIAPHGPERPGQPQLLLPRLGHPLDVWGGVRTCKFLMPILALTAVFALAAVTRPVRAVGLAVVVVVVVIVVVVVVVALVVAVPGAAAAPASADADDAAPAPPATPARSCSRDDRRRDIGASSSRHRTIYPTSATLLRCQQRRRQ